MDVVLEFDKPAACVIKHNNPSGISENADLALALREAVACDSLSAFGGILGLNRSCDEGTAKTALELLNFFEIIVAPAFAPKALELLKARKNLRIIETGPLPDAAGLDLRHLRSGVLAQDRDASLRTRTTQLKKQIRVVTQKKLTAKEIEDLLFAFKCVKVVKSNAIVFTQGRRTVGIGAGQMSRVDSVEIAAKKAGKLTQTEVATILDTDQGTVSRIENRDDLLLSTLRQYLAAAGAVHAKIVVEKEGVEITLDLDSFG